MYFCRDCGASGWLSRRLATDDRYCSDVKTINTSFMNRDKEVVLLNTESKRHEAVEEYISEGKPQCDSLCKGQRPYRTSSSDEGTIRLRVCSKTGPNKNGNQKFARNCPECNGNDTICEIGGRNLNAFECGHKPGAI